MAKANDMIKDVINDGKSTTDTLSQMPNFRQILLKTKVMFEKAKMEPSELFTTTSKDINATCHNQILDFLAKASTKEGGITQLYADAHYYLCNRAENETDYRDDIMYKTAKVLYDYMDQFNNVFFTIKNGKVTLTGIENFELPSITEDMTGKTKEDIWKADIDYITRSLEKKPAYKNELEVLIQNNGKIMFAPNTHKTLSNWLNATGIADLHGAIRVEATKTAYAQSRFDMTSLFNYHFSKSSTNDELVKISNGQAQAIGALHSAVSYGWRNVPPFEDTMKFSTGFGIGMRDHEKDTDMFFTNMKQLSHAVDFDRRAYSDELRSAGMFSKLIGG